MFDKTQNEEFMQVMEARLRNDYLDWVEQFLDIIEAELTLQYPLSLNDIGCNVGHFWKGLKRRNLDIDYCGYDIEERYLAFGRSFFPELEEKLILSDITQERPRQADVTVVSATLEHLPELSPGLDNLFETTSRLAVIRTFLGEDSRHDSYLKPEAELPYGISQFAFTDFLGQLDHLGFSTEVVRERHTDSMPKFIAQGIVRTQYVVIARRVRS